jgi:hypothetical protein
VETLHDALQEADPDVPSWRPIDEMYPEASLTELLDRATEIRMSGRNDSVTVAEPRLHRRA